MIGMSRCAAALRVQSGSFPPSEIRKVAAWLPAQRHRAVRGGEFRGRSRPGCSGTRAAGRYDPLGWKG